MSIFSLNDTLYKSRENKELNNDYSTFKLRKQKTIKEIFTSLPHQYVIN